MQASTPARRLSLGMRLAILVLLALASRHAIGAAQPIEEPTGSTRADGVETTAFADGSVAEFVDAGEVALVPLTPAAGERPQDLAQTDLIEEMDFEDATFPPEGWELEDVGNNLPGPDALDTWSRQICQTPPGDGGLASAWVVGGGSNGADMACGQNIGRPVNTRMLRREIDASSYPFGIQIDLNVWLDLPVAGDSRQAMRICWFDGVTLQGQCTSAVIPPSRPDLVKQWLSFSSPIAFPDAANKPSIIVAFWFNDGTGTGEYAGAFVDNVRIEGLTEAPPPTATPLITNTPQPTVPVTPPTPTISPTPTERARISFLPMLMVRADKDDPEHIRSQYVEVWFGTALDSSDRVQGIETRFPYGQMRLCAQVNWFGWPADTEVRWQWYQKSGPRFEPIQSPTLNDSIVTGQETRPYASRCIRAVDGEGNDVPIWMNEYKVDVFVGDSSQAAASQIAEVYDGGTLTPTPTTPTSPPISTPVPGEAGCQQVIENGDFEQGPSVGWQLATNVQPPNNTTSRVIVRGADLGLNAAGGEWLSVTGRAVNVRDQLLSKTFTFPEASDIVSASLQFNFGLVTEETKDGSHDDILGVGLVPASGGNATGIPRSGFSEEVIEPDSWYSFTEPLDITQLVTARPGWTGAQLIFESLNSAEAATAHLLDEIELVICTGSATPLRQPELPSAGRIEPLVPSEVGLASPAALSRGARIERVPGRLR